MAEQYSKEHIFKLVNNKSYLSFNTLSNKKIISRYMLFACNSNLDKFYFVTHKLTQKVEQIKKIPFATFSLLMEQEQLGDTSQISIHGIIDILDDFKHQEVQEGLKLLSKKSPMIKMMIDGGSLGDYVVLVLSTKEINFSVYNDIIENKPATIMRY